MTAPQQQTLLVLVGLPGSGKSTLAQLFRQQGWAVICQDELGDRKACEAACWKALVAGLSVVIDRCNHNMQQRSHWLQIARQVQAQRRSALTGPIQLAALVLELPAALCMQRAAGREGHATLPADQAAEVIQRFISEWQVPTAREGFGFVEVARSAEQAHAAASALLRQPAALVEPAVPAAAPVMLPGAVMPAGGGFQAQEHLSAGASAFRPGQPWQTQMGAPVLLIPMQQPQQGWAQQAQQAQQGWTQQAQQAQQGWAPLPQGQQLQSGWQQQQQQQQQRQYTSRADAASSWRQGAEGSSGSQQDQQDQQDQRHPGPGGRPGDGTGWGQQQQQWQGPNRSRSPPRPGKHWGEGRGRGAAASGNILPFPGRSREGQGWAGHQQQQQQQGEQHAQQQEGPQDPNLPRRHPWQHYSYNEPSGTLLDQHTGAKVILMFDANGCITSHTSMRRSSGIHKARPGTHHLWRLKEHFHVGMYSSASAKTIDTALALLEKAAGPGEGRLFDRRLILNRTHTALAPLAHVQSGGKQWDTCKPLRPYFSRLHRVILVDDDSHKACPGEEGNMLLMPCWHKDDPSDTMVGQLVDVLLQLAEALEEDPEADVRQFTADASAQLAAVAQEQASAGQQGQEGGEQQSEAAQEAAQAEAAAEEAAASEWEREQEEAAAEEVAAAEREHEQGEPVSVEEAGQPAPELASPVLA